MLNKWWQISPPNWKNKKQQSLNLKNNLQNRKEQVLRLEGAIEALNMTIKKPENAVEDGIEVKWV